MKQNLFIEYRRWVFFWGLFIDGQSEVQKALDKYNAQGWYCVQFEWTGSNKLSIFKLLFVLVITILTLGIISYWTGFSIVFERALSPNQSNESAAKPGDNTKLEIWRKNNPGKSVNDFYRERV